MYFFNSLYDKIFCFYSWVSKIRRLFCYLYMTRLQESNEFLISGINILSMVYTLSKFSFTLSTVSFYNFIQSSKLILNIFLSKFKYFAVVFESETLNFFNFLTVFVFFGSNLSRHSGLQ